MSRTVGEIERDMSARELREWQIEFRIRSNEERDRALESRARALARGR